ncbi:PAS domain-containing protein [Neosynechococcus sphagnicola]|uniref:PAS domain-containing protein n=1 Tax=Neosynechococcus sphagnicola TaxID=1501145 RepID=UPI0023BA53E0|nr:PAS domain-containing protein [Neosynechococcus sphagnicola]
MIIYSCQAGGDFSCTFISENVTVLLGYTTAEFMAEPGFWAQRLHPDDAPRIFAGLAPLFEQGHHIHEYRFLHSDGHYIWVQDELKLVRNPAGEPDELVGCFTIIDDRKQAEIVLRESEQKYRHLIENIQAGFVVHAPNTRILQCNAHACDLLRLSMDQMLGTAEIDPTWQFVHEDGTVMSLEDYPVNQVLATQSILRNYVVGISQAAEVQTWVLVTAFPEFDTQGQLTQVVVTFIDISDRHKALHKLKKAEAQLRNLSDRLNLAVQSAKIGIWDWDIVNDHLIWDDRMYELYGIQPSDFCGAYEAWEAGLHPEDLLVNRTMTQQVLANQRELETEFRVVWPDGTIHYLEALALVQRAPDGQLLRLIGVNRDISERKAAEAALRESEARYRSVISAMAEGVVLQQADGKITAFNASAEQILGLTPEQILGKTSLELHWRTIHEDGSPFPGDTHPTMITLTTGQPQSQVVMGICKGDNTTTWISINSQPLFHPDHPLPDAVVSSFADITKLKQAELALKSQSEQRWLLTTIAQHIRQTLDLDQILQTTVNEVRQLLQTDRVIIYQFEPDWSGIIIAESVAAAWSSILGMQITDTFFVETQGHSYLKGFVKGTNDIYTANLDPCHVVLLEQMQVRAKLVVPILLEDRLWGLLVAQHCQSPRHWEALEIELQQHLATQIAIAIQQSELYQTVQALNTNLELQVKERTAQLQQSLEFEALLKRITDRVRDSLDEGQILQTAVEELAQGLAVAACDTGIYNLEQTTSTIAYEFTHILSPAQGQTFEIANSSHPETYPQLLSGQICYFCDVSLNPLRSDQQLLTTLAVPIVDDQGVLGDLWLFKSPSDEFNDQEVRLVKQVANQCAIALRQSRLYQAAQAQVQELKRLSQLKDDFLSTVSHELRSPISSIKMATKMLEISLNRLGILEDQSQSIHRYVKILRDEGQREANLINDLLDLARLDAGKEPLNLTPISLQVYIPQLAETFLERIRQQQQQLAIHIPAHLPDITTDVTYLERILTELLHNACKYTPARETITVSAQATTKALEIRVSNSGVEIPAPECDRIFDKFYRIPNNDPWKHGGTGLGLALVKKLIEQMGGNIHVESSSGQTTFILELGFFSTSIAG